MTDAVKDEVLARLIEQVELYLFSIAHMSGADRRALTTNDAMANAVGGDINSVATGAS